MPWRIEMTEESCITLHTPEELYAALKLEARTVAYEGNEEVDLKGHGILELVLLGKARAQNASHGQFTLRDEAYLITTLNSVAQVTLFDNSQVQAYGYTKVTAYGNSHMRLCNSARGVARDQSEFVANDRSQVEVFSCRKGFVTDYALAKVHGESHVQANEKSFVELYNQACVEAWGLARVRAWDKSHTMAAGEVSVEGNNEAYIELWVRATATVKDKVRVKAIENSFVHVAEDSRAHITLSDMALCRNLSCNATIDWRLVEPFTNTVTLKKPLYGIKYLSSKGDVPQIEKRTFIAEIELPVGARVQSIDMDIWRADQAKVVWIKDDDGQPVESAASSLNRNFIYTQGKTVVPTTPFDPLPRPQGNGIHFFLLGGATPQSREDVI
jgi:hypothetical protein